MRRRDLILFAGAASLRPLAGIAQQAKVPTIGVLVVGAPSSQTFWRLFKNSLHELGYIDGQTARFEFRSDEGHSNRLPELAAELVRLNVDVLVTWFTPAATAAKQATRDIPIVMAAAGDPLATGLVASLAHPGGNITGTSAMAADLAGKCVELLREMLPAAHRLMVLVNAPDPFSKPFLEKIRNAGKATATIIDPVMIQAPQELDAAFAATTKEPPGALIVQPSLPIKRAAELALQYRLPSASPFRPFAEAGGLMSYWFDEATVYRQSAILVDKVLKGARPADLPVEQPTKFELVINLKTAKALGLAVPQSLLQRADQVIE